jgi:hypothetical protein
LKNIDITVVVDMALNEPAQGSVEDSDRDASDEQGSDDVVRTGARDTGTYTDKPIARLVQVLDAIQLHKHDTEHSTGQTSGKWMSSADFIASIQQIDYTFPRSTEETHPSALRCRWTTSDFEYGFVEALCTGFMLFAGNEHLADLETHAESILNVSPECTSVDTPSRDTKDAQGGIWEDIHALRVCQKQTQKGMRRVTAMSFTRIALQLIHDADATQVHRLFSMTQNQVVVHAYHRIREEKDRMNDYPGLVRMFPYRSTTRDDYADQMHAKHLDEWKSVYAEFMAWYESANQFASSAMHHRPPRKSSRIPITSSVYFFFVALLGVWEHYAESVDVLWDDTVHDTTRRSSSFLYFETAFSIPKMGDRQYDLQTLYRPVHGVLCLSDKKDIMVEIYQLRRIHGEAFQQYSRSHVVAYEEALWDKNGMTYDRFCKTEVSYMQWKQHICDTFRERTSNAHIGAAGNPSVVLKNTSVKGMDIAAITEMVVFILILPEVIPEMKTYAESVASPPEVMPFTKADMETCLHFLRKLVHLAHMSSQDSDMYTYEDYKNATVTMETVSSTKKIIMELRKVFHSAGDLEKQMVCDWYIRECFHYSTLHRHYLFASCIH